MRIKHLVVAMAAAGLYSSAALAQTEIQWWHSMTGALGDRVTGFANEFNASQKDYKIVPVYKGTYPESMTAAIAAVRAGNAPHILQVFEVGTATMMSAGKAIKPATVTKVVERAESYIIKANLRTMDAAVDRLVATAGTITPAPKAKAKR